MINKEKLHEKLQKPKVRGLILIPSMVIMIIGGLIGVSSIYYGFTPPSYILPIYKLNLAYFVIGLMFIFWSDLRKIKNKHKLK